MESNLVQPWDRIDSGKNTLNERPKRSKFLTTANLSSITQWLQLHGHVTKKGRQKQRRRPGQATNWLQLQCSFLRSMLNNKRLYWMILFHDVTSV